MKRDNESEKKQMKDFYAKTDNYSLTKIIGIDETSI